ncbi:MAG: NADH-quinone oxidoreductase subunit NuoE [Hyphomonadaceae bacterium]|nr:NADH-quinone oxidoreductase subunit NuoE [Clostridia bacterium]
MCKNELSEKMYQELADFIESLDTLEGSLITVLHQAQHIFGYLPKEVQLFISRKLELPAARVFGVVTFYSYFTQKPRGEHVINVCMGTACFVRGAEGILNAIEDKLGIKSGQTTEDGKFTIDALRCVGACGLAPVIMVDGKVHGRVKLEEVEGILAKAVEEDVLV